MKKLLFACVLLLAAAFLVTSCKKDNAAANTGKRILHIYNWGDYLSPGVIRAFEKEYNCKVKEDAFDSNEAMYAKLKAGASGYDIIVPSSYMAELMNRQGMLQKIDHSKIPNVVKNIDRGYLKYALDTQMEYTVPYFFSFTGIGYNKKRVKDFEPSWRMFERQDLKKRCSLLNDVRETMSAALCTLGYDVNTTDQKQIDEAVALLQNWKKQIAKFEVDDSKRALASGEFNLIHTYSGDMLQVMAENPDIDFVIPKEGSDFTIDNFAILKNSPNPDLAHAFIDFIYRTEQAVINMNEIMYTMAHKEAMLQVDETLRNNPAFNIPEEIRARCQLLKDLGAENEKYNKAWNLIRQE